MPLRLSVEVDDEGGADDGAEAEVRHAAWNTPEQLSSGTAEDCAICFDRADRAVLGGSTRRYIGNKLFFFANKPFFVCKQVINKTCLQGKKMAFFWCSSTSETHVLTN